MGSKSIRVDVAGDEYSSVILIDKIIRLSKSKDGELTHVHLLNNEVINSEDSMNTIQARIDLA